MKQLLLLLFLFIFTFNSFSQNYKFSIELSYPYILNLNEKSDFSNGENQKNIIDVGLKYAIIQKSIFELGIGINGSYLKTRENNLNNFPIYVDSHKKYYLIVPKIYGSIKLFKEQKIRAFLALGYNFQSERLNYLRYSSNVPAGFPNYTSGASKNSKNGFNLNTGLTFDISKRFFLQAQYDILFYSKEKYLNKDDLNLIKFGLGFRI